MKKYALLGASNINMNIDVEIFLSMEDAVDAMNTEYNNTVNGFGSVQESDIDRNSASVLDHKGNLYYWQAKEIEV